MNKLNMSNRIEWIKMNMLSVLGMLYISENKDKIAIAPALFFKYLVFGGTFFMALGFDFITNGFDIVNVLVLVSILFVLTWTLILYMNREDKLMIDRMPYYRKVFMSWNTYCTL